MVFLGHSEMCMNLCHNLQRINPKVSFLSPVVVQALSSSSPPLRLPLFASMAVASSSWQGALAPAQGNLVQEDDLVITSYNVGARGESYMRSAKNRPVFFDKLQKDIKALVDMGTDILCLQELNDVWLDAVENMLPDWDRSSSQSMTLSTFVKPGLHILSTAEVAIFPESLGRKSARKILQVVVGRSCVSAEQQQTWNVWNNHTIVGSDKNFKVNGDFGKFMRVGFEESGEVGSGLQASSCSSAEQQQAVFGVAGRLELVLPCSIRRCSSKDAWSA